MSRSGVRLVLAGDIMLARGIDQIQRRHVSPELRERAVTDARGYVALAERANGPIPRNVEPCYVWGDAHDDINRFQPDATVLNLENALTTSDDFDPEKGIHYRSHPENGRVIECVPRPICTVANNHLLDLGASGLAETLSTLANRSIPCAGAGKDAAAARGPAVRTLERPQSGSRIAVIACGVTDSGIPRHWGAAPGKCGVHLLTALDTAAVDSLRPLIAEAREQATTVLLSIHWGGNWGYAVPDAHCAFAHAVVDEGIADIVYGHSSHHPRPFEMYHGSPIFYGCGDFINDYEGIRGHAQLRPEIRLLYCLEQRADSWTVEILPFEAQRFTLHRAGEQDGQWIAETLSRENAAVDGPQLVYSTRSIRVRTGIE